MRGYSEGPAGLLHFFVEWLVHALRCGGRAEEPTTCIVLTDKETYMNWDEVEGKWKQVAGSARQRWGKLTDSDWQIIAGKKEQLLGRIQERYGIAKGEAEKQADDWARTLADEPAVKR
jgi:uncharacterized protein YjbJ (UPF0337 family)